jgi:hypothetical protein
MKAEIRESTITKLIDAAISVLHHDTSEGSEVDKYERDALRTRFKAILYVPRKLHGTKDMRHAMD